MSACDDTGLAVISQQLLDCAVAGLAECERPVCRDFLAASASVAWDECCECASGGNGMLWVSLTEISPVLGDPERVGPCGWEYEATYAIGILRCDKTANLSASGKPPAPEVFTQQAREQMQDARIIRAAITCCFAELHPDPGDFTLGAWSPLGPDGGCVGGQQLVTLRFTDCACG